MAESLQDKNSDLISKRWAHALMDLVCEDEAISKDDVLKDLEFISETISSSDELYDVIKNPSISTEEKQIVLCKLFQNKVADLVYNFVFALNLRKRFYLINEIASEFKNELDVFNNIKHVHITSAIELDNEKKNNIREKIASKLNANIDINWGVDNDIIAGLIFNIDETIVDNSIRHKLEDLSENIGVNINRN